jgi:NAD(P)-dependent dehydrogenase (short-subunit alcohol dehydrogenase family)
MFKPQSKENDMAKNKTAIVTGAQQGIGAGLVGSFLKSSYSVVATSPCVSESLRLTPKQSYEGIACHLEQNAFATSLHRAPYSS